MDTLTLTLTLGEDRLEADVGGRAVALPVGVRQLLDAGLHSDPPLPEELTNAIGEVSDHLEDLVREVPAIFDYDVEVRGLLVEVVADVEAGARAPLPRRLRRDDVEEVFRTLVTESSDDRRRNPGLPLNEVERIVAACCILVAVVRRLHLTEVVLAP